MTEYGHYAIDHDGIRYRLPDGTWKQVRSLDAAELERVRNACAKLPATDAERLLSLLDPSRRTPDDPAERWAWTMVEKSERGA